MGDAEVQTFICPSTDVDVCASWEHLRQGMLEDNDIVKHTRLIAWRENEACAAGIFFIHTNSRIHNYYLSKLIGNGEAGCKGAGSEILCKLIAESRDQNGKWTPLELFPEGGDETPLAAWYRTFGCD